jgi:hypothetical protein
MADLIYGSVKAIGKKENVLNMFEELEDYYDKGITSQKGANERYTINFEFASKIMPFLSYGDYFQSYSEAYECKIVAELQMEGLEGEEEPMRLEYDNGEIVHGLSEYGLCDF